MFTAKARSVLVRFTSLATAIAMIWLCVLPVSASEQITLLDWGWGKEDNVTTYATGCYLFKDPNDAFDNLYRSSVVTNMFGFTAAKGYTYTYEHTYQLRGNLNSFKVANGELLNKIGYKYSLYSDESTDTYSYQKYTGVIDTALVSVTKIDDQTYRLKVVYNPDKSGLQIGDIYLFTTVLQKITQGDVTITVGNEILTCIKDLDGTVFEQSLIDAVAAMREDNNNYFTNALAVLDQIKANGDEANIKLDEMPGKIGEELDKHDDKVKQEAGTEGNDNINQATSALTNALPIASISDAIAPLITACSYNGTTSVWTFPTMKIPAIAGLFNEIQLNEAQNFDLCSYAEQYIPDDLLTLIRAVTTVLLIIWAIREIMSLLSNFLGGGNNVGSG